jgi:6,7-dimethyl-8-ribityllumazine synthase
MSADGSPRIALCVARYYGDLSDKLEEGASDALNEEGVTQIDRFEVPGAFELPLVARYVAQSGRYDAIIALGAVIRGETDHYDFVCHEAARGLQQVQLESGIPVGFGVLTVNSYHQAQARVKGGGKRDSGRAAAEAALAALGIKRQLSS